MTKRQAALAAVKIAAYHNDARALTRLRIESRLGIEAFNTAAAAGTRARAAGVPCSCSDCNGGNYGPQTPIIDRLV